MKLAVATLLASAALGAFAIARVWNFTCDDAFITFRYSRNLVRGVGPTYNVEPPRAEGYTSFLWMALMAVPHLAHADPVATAKVLGVALTLLTVGACFGIGWSLCGDVGRDERVLGAALGAALFAAYHLTAVHAVSGMETALAAFLLALLAWLAVSERWAGSPAVPCCALLLGLARPELNLACVTLLVAAFLRLDAGQRRRFLAWVALLYVVPGAVYFLWRLSYYRLFLPLPFYVKAATLTPRGLSSAAHFGAEVALCFGVFLALSLAGLPRKCLPLLAVVLVVGLYLLFPEHVMGYGHRFFHPLVPLIAALSARGAAFVLSALRGRLGPRGVAVPYIGFLVLGLAPVCSRYEIVWGECAQYARGMDNAHVRLGKLLRECAAGGDAVLAIRDAGAVPYYSGWETVDCAGLNDPHIAMAGEPEPSYVLGRRPSLVVLQSQRPDKFLPHEASEQALFDECVRRGMRNVGTLEFKSGYYLWLMARPDGALAGALRAGLRRPG